MPFRYVRQCKGIITTIVSRDVIKKAGLRQSFLAVSFKVAEKAGGDIFLQMIMSAVDQLLLLCSSYLESSVEKFHHK